MAESIGRVLSVIFCRNKRRKEDLEHGISESTNKKQKQALTSDNWIDITDNNGSQAGVTVTFLNALNATFSQRSGIHSFFKSDIERLKGRRL